MISTEADGTDLTLDEGWICLDFANTGMVAHDLTDVSDLTMWAREIGLITNDEAGRLLREASSRPREAEQSVAEARHQRALLRRIFGAVAAGDWPSDDDLRGLNRRLNEALSQLRLVPTAAGYALGWTEWSAVDCILWPVVKSAADLLCSEHLDRIGQCTAADCDWLFLDTSKNRSRRWCSMRRCGNRAKVRRYHQRQQERSS